MRRALALTGRRLTVTEKNWLAAVGVVAACVLAFHLLAFVEGRWVGGLHPRDRLVYHPVETSMRCMAIPHFLIALLFTFSSRRLRSNRNRLHFLALILVGVALCFGYTRLGGAAAVLPGALFLAYFLVHEFRDEAFFYVVNGDAPPGTDTPWLQRRVLVGPAFAVLFFLAGGFGVAALGVGRIKLDLGGLSFPARAVVAVLPIATVVLFMVLLARRARRKGIGTLLATYPPLFNVSLGILLVVLLDFALHERMYAIVSLHVAAWFVFILHQFANRPPVDPAPPRFGWAWMRQTRGGFLFLHVGLFVLVTAGAAVWAYRFGNGRTPSVFWVVLSREAFPFWTIMHITMSFLPR